MLFLLVCKMFFGDIWCGAFSGNNGEVGVRVGEGMRWTKSLERCEQVNEGMRQMKSLECIGVAWAD